MNEVDEFHPEIGDFVNEIGEFVLELVRIIPTIADFNRRIANSVHGIAEIIREFIEFVTEFRKVVNDSACIRSPASRRSQGDDPRPTTLDHALKIAEESPVRVRSTETRPRCVRTRTEGRYDSLT